MRRTCEARYLKQYHQEYAYLIEHQLGTYLGLGLEPGEDLNLGCLEESMNNLNSVLLDVCISNSIYCNELSVYGHDLNRGGVHELSR